VVRPAQSTAWPLLPVLGVIVVLAVSPLARDGQPPGRGEDQASLAARASARIRALEREADQLAAAARTVFNDLRRLEIDRAVAEQQIVEADARLALVTAERDEALARVTSLEAQRIAETPGVEQRLVSIYRRGRGGYIRLLLSSDDPRAFGRLTRGVAAIATLDRLRLETHRRTLAAERQALADLERQHADVAAGQQAATRARSDLDAAVRARNQAIAALDTRRDLAAQFVAELERAQASLQQTVATLDGASPQAAAALPFRPFRGDLDWPARGPVLTRFGPSRHDRFGTSIVRNGIEIGAAEGTPARAVHGGTVAYAAPFAGFGTLVIVDHGDRAFTLYGHLGESTLARGARIGRGEVIGAVGLAPAGQSALYFEVRIDGRPVDPLQWLRSSP
jgi:septal ring factor EnvC (AmiA/AmiB activator)